MTTQLPRDREARAARRIEIREYMIYDALREAEKRSRSLKCGDPNTLIGPQHADDPNGCANDGSTCLCECHDRPKP